ncbi:tail protein [Bacillus phage W.Ph.]|uniref:Gp32 n=1 Tax=Bacillus phage W.Ph. TaxID=764595 RepID=G9B1D3_9CAUD|nr:tail protein [Bacillus phage W.Ph.]ADH03178.1 gp32 [Bacillus phage W.Ph.]
MASGSFIIGTSNRYVEGKCYWDAWADPNRNVSKINVSVYFYRTNFGYTTSGTFTFILYSSFGEKARNTRYFTFTNPNGGNGTQVLNASWEQPHDSNGNLNFRISVGKDSDVFSLQNNGGDIVADKIPRESTVASKPSAALPNDIWIDLNVNNSTFHHTVELWAKNTSGVDTLIDTQTNVGPRAYYSVSARPDLRKKLAQTLGNRNETALWATCVTYDANGYQIGGKKWGAEGRLYRPNLGFIAAPKLYVNEGVTARIGSFDGRLQYKVHVCIHLNYDGGGGGAPPPAGNAKFRKIYTPTSETFTINFTQAEQNQIATTTMTDKTFRVVTYQVDTMCEGVLLNSNNVAPSFSNGTIDISRMPNIQPVFNATPIVVDTNAKTIAVTNNSAYIIQGQSIVQVKVPSANKAVPQLGASIVRYDITINGVTTTHQFPATGDLVVNKGVVNAAANTTCVVTAVDSRGLNTSVNRIVSIIPYQPPTVSASGIRKNNFESSTTVSASGVYSPVMVGSTNKNTIKTKTFRRRILGGTYEGNVTFPTVNLGSGTYVVKYDNYNFDVDKIYEVEVTIQDSIADAIKTTFILSKGTPIAFMDSKSLSLGVNMVPVKGNDENKLQVTGSAYISDNVKTQVMLFPVTGAENNPAAPNSQYSTLQLKNDTMMMNGKDIFHQIGRNSNLRLAGDFYSSDSTGIYFDRYGNIKSQAGVHTGSTWSIYDSKGTPIITIPLWDRRANGKVQLNIGGMLMTFNESANAVSFSALDGRPASLWVGDIHGKLV